MANRAKVYVADPSEGLIPLPTGNPAVLAVSPLHADRVGLREILAERNWKLVEASDCREALAAPCRRIISLLLCASDHADGPWEDILNATAERAVPPNFIVFSRLADESLWAEVLNLGGFDVLMTPFEPKAVLLCTFAAWSRWESDFAASPAKKQMRQADQLTPADDFPYPRRAVGASA